MPNTRRQQEFILCVGVLIISLAMVMPSLFSIPYLVIAISLVLLAVLQRGKLKIDFGLLFLCCAFFYGLVLVFIGKVIFRNFLIEAKVLFLPCVFFIGRFLSSLRHGSLLLYVVKCLFMTFACAQLCYSVFFHGKFFRFSDVVPIRFGMISIYMGVTCLMFYIFEPKGVRKVIWGALVILSGSGTALLGFLTHLLFYRKFNLTRYLQVSVLGVSLFAIIIFTQAQRSRDITDLQSIDRYLIAYGFVLWVNDHYSPMEYLVGRGAGATADELPDYIPSVQISEYIEGDYGAEGISGRALHNEFFRLFLNYGVIGLIIVYGLFFRYLSGKLYIVLPILVMSLFNSILYVAPVTIALSVLSAHRARRS